MANLIVWLLLLAPPGAAPSTPQWQKVYESNGPRRWIGDIAAVDRAQVFVGGAWGVARVTGHDVEVHETGGLGIERLIVQGRRSVFALGERELILHFDGVAWEQEHIGEPLGDNGRGRRDVLHAGFYPPGSAEGGLVALGADVVLERGARGDWTTPAGPRRAQLIRASLGPDPLPAPGCSGGPWFWFDRSDAWFSCDDGRTFLFHAGQTRSTGRRPASCRTVGGAARSGDAVYAVCAENTLWKIEGRVWRRLSPPPTPDHEFVALSFAGGCLFLSNRRSVWRWCGP
jgi:hypothetical protein